MVLLDASIQKASYAQVAINCTPNGHWPVRLCSCSCHGQRVLWRYGEQQWVQTSPLPYFGHTERVKKELDHSDKAAGGA